MWTGRESNPHHQFRRLLYSHYTTGPLSKPKRPGLPYRQALFGTDDCVRNPSITGTTVFLKILLEATTIVKDFFTNFNSLRSGHGGHPWQWPPMAVTTVWTVPGGPGGQDHHRHRHDGGDHPWPWFHWTIHHCHDYHGGGDLQFVLPTLFPSSFQHSICKSIGLSCSTFCGRII